MVNRIDPPMMKGLHLPKRVIIRPEKYGAGEHADDHRDGQQSGLGGASAARSGSTAQERDGTEECQTDHDRGDDRQRGGALGDDLERDDRSLALDSTYTVSPSRARPPIT